MRCEKSLRSAANCSGLCLCRPTSSRFTAASTAGSWPSTLTPIGRGQTMLLIGQEGTGKSTLAWDALLAQARSDVHCVLALTTGSASLAAAKLAELERRGDGLHRRTTIVAVAREGAAERLLTVASAAAVAEAVRDSGGHALLIVDDLGGLLDAWDIAGEAVDAQRAGRGCSSLDKHGSSEQRIFFASLLQRAAQLKESKGSGSLTMLLLVTQPTPLRPAMPSTPACFTLDDFASHSPAERKRVEALASRGIPLDAATLTKIRIPLPTRRGGSPDTAHGARDAAERQVAAHTDQLKSLADGHIYLHADLAAAGRFPSIRADECLGRVGAGSGINKRPQPMTAAMSEISPSLRLELAQALDLPPVDLDSFTRDQRLRVRSTDALLRSQQPGKPRRLSEELVLLHALLQGRLDHLADRTTEEVNAEVASVIQGVEAILGPSALDAIDGTGRLEGDMKVQFAAAIAKQLPKARGRAFFVSYDKDTWQERSADKQTDGTH